MSMMCAQVQIILCSCDQVADTFYSCQNWILKRFLCAWFDFAYMIIAAAHAHDTLIDKKKNVKNWNLVEFQVFKVVLCDFMTSIIWLAGRLKWVCKISPKKNPS